MGVGDGVLSGLQHKLGANMAGRQQQRLTLKVSCGKAGGNGEATEEVGQLRLPPVMLLLGNLVASDMER